MAAILDSAAVKQPAERDLEVYRLVVVEGKTTRAAAEIAKISQTRICQVVERVMQWLSTVLPATAQGLPEESRLLLAQQIAISRLDHLYGEAMAAWRASQAEGAKGSQQGNVRYLAAAMNISAKLAKIPSSLLPLATMRCLTNAAPALAPLVGDCSASATEQAAAEEQPEVDECGIVVPTTPYEAALAPEPTSAGEFSDVFAPVQTSFFAGSKAVSTSLLTPAALPLTRKQRRARQRLLEKKLRKAK